MLNNCSLKCNKWVLNEFIHSRQLFNPLIPSWLTRSFVTGHEINLIVSTLFVFFQPFGLNESFRNTVFLSITTHKHIHFQNSRKWPRSFFSHIKNTWRTHSCRGPWSTVHLSHSCSSVTVLQERRHHNFAHVNSPHIACRHAHMSSLSRPHRSMTSFHHSLHCPPPPPHNLQSLQSFPSPRDRRRFNILDASN